MNKQQLAAKIWTSADTLRSKIEAYEYKDYILGLMFYMYLSNNEELFLYEQGWDSDSISEFDQDQPTVDMVRQSLGYCIRYQDLFSSWINPHNNFSVESVSTAISAFNRSIYHAHKPLFENIFESLETGLSKLGESAGAQTKALRGIINIISDIPISEEQNYDVLGFVYEYLISHFAAGAGKKAGEFYTPHQVSELMSKIVAFHLRDRNEVKIYDPTSGSGSLLITMGSSLEQYHVPSSNIYYFAQELKANTYNLTRMNLVMRGIAPGNIEVNNADTLEKDWPLETTYDDEGKLLPAQPLHVDAVVSNPPYSQQWDNENKELDPRFQSFGLAPSSKADYAFLLHDLYHLNKDGIMTIVLPHGVLFRGGEEGKIREQLLKRNHIDAIIGLPANIFFGTGIPTIVMVLKRTRFERNILMVDASQGFIKDGKNNLLRAQDIQKVVDAVITRASIPHFSRAVSLEEVAQNSYNLNLTRYVSATQESEHWDLAGLTLGQIPTRELTSLHFTSYFPQLQHHLFSSTDSKEYVALTPELLQQRNSYDLATYLKGQFDSDTEVQSQQSQYLKGVEAFLKDFKAHFIPEKMQAQLSELHPMQLLPELQQSLFAQLVTDHQTDRFVVAPYDTYQCLYETCQLINSDIETLQQDGLTALNIIDDIPETKKNKQGQLITKIVGQEGRVIPLKLIKEHYCQDLLNALEALEQPLAECESQLQSLLESLSDEDKELYFVAGALNEAGDAWNKTGLTAQLKRPEVKAELKNLPELNDTMTRAAKLLKEKGNLEKANKQARAELEEKAAQILKQLNQQEALALLEVKWFNPLQEQLAALFTREIERAAQDLAALITKYQVTPSAIEHDIAQSNQALSAMLSELTSNNSSTMNGLNELKQLLEL